MHAVTGMHFFTVLHSSWGAWDARSMHMLGYTHAQYDSIRNIEVNFCDPIYFDKFQSVNYTTTNHSKHHCLVALMF